MSWRRTFRRASGAGVFAALAACAGGNNTPDAVPFDPATIAISPAMPHTQDDLNAVVSTPGSSGYTTRWSMDGTVRNDVSGFTVDDALTARDQVWKVELLSAAGAVVTSTEVTILDTPPTAPVVTIPTSPPSQTALRCAVATDSTDVDADAITYTASWLHNTAPFANATTTSFANDTVPAEYVQIGDTFVCTVTASDGAMMVTASTSIAVVVDRCTVTPLPGPTTYQFTGGLQTYAVPDCAHTITIEAWGAQGNGGSGATGPMGGNGGYARGDLVVTAGEELTLVVGGQNGYGGGGAGQAQAGAANGGGASDVRRGGTTLNNRVIVAGGGGGGIDADVGDYRGGAGGGGTCLGNYCGGGGGTGWGGTGSAGSTAGGGGITAVHAGGAGGGGATSGGGASCETNDQPATCGGNGTLGQGGAGGPAQAHAICYTTYGGTAGGGGGYYGGGGSAIGFCGGGGGGGGASWVGQLTSPVMTGNARAGDGVIVITPKN